MERGSNGEGDRIGKGPSRSAGAAKTARVSGLCAGGSGRSRVARPGPSKAQSCLTLPALLVAHCAICGVDCCEPVMPSLRRLVHNRKVRILADRPADAPWALGGKPPPWVRDDCKECGFFHARLA